METRLQLNIINKHYNGNAKEYRLQNLISEELDLNWEIQNREKGIFVDELGHLIKVEQSDIWHVTSIKRINEKDEVLEEIKLEDFIR